MQGYGPFAVELTAGLIVTFTAEFGAVIDARRLRMRVFVGGTVADFALDVTELQHPQRVSCVE